MKKLTLTLVSVWTVFVLLLALPACAGEVSLQAENDLFFHADHSYTHGTKLSYMGEPNNVPRWLEDDEWKSEQRIGASLGQNIYTPVDKFTVPPPEDQRPYAGWLYLGAVYQKKTPKYSDFVEIDLGVVGPSAFGEETQNTIHDWVGSREALGWDYQIHDEVAGVAVCRRSFDMVDIHSGKVGFQAAPHTGFALGTVVDYANAGLTVRAGWNLPDYFGPSVVTPSMERTIWDGSDDFMVYFYSSVDGRYVARNIFLDGNTFSDSRSVEKENWVGDLEAGVTAGYSGSSVSFGVVRRSPEYDGDTYHDYASVNFKAGF